MSLSLLGCLQIGVLPAGSIGPHRVGVYLRLINQRRNWCTARSSARTRRGLRQCVEPPCATGIWDNEAAPPCEVIRSGLVYRSKHAPVGSSGTTIRILDGYRRPGRDNRTVPTRRRGALVNIAHFWKFDGATAGNDFLTTAIKIRSMVGRRTAAVALKLTRADARELMRCNNRRALWNKRSR